MNNVVLARIFDSVTSEFTLGQISKILNMSVDEILDGLEKLVGKEIAPNLNYLMRNERTFCRKNSLGGLIKSESNLCTTKCISIQLMMMT